MRLAPDHPGTAAKASSHISIARTKPDHLPCSVRGYSSPLQRQGVALPQGPALLRKSREGFIS